MMTEREISTAFPFEPHFVSVNSAKMHYIERGTGDPILFIHGMPTWSYLWRNVLPDVSGLGHCIALDLIGFGRSDKPKINYTVKDHIAYVEKFIEALDLHNITLVMHGWGSVIGFDYAMKHPENIKSLIFYEAHVRANVDWDMLSLPVQELTALLDRGGKASERAIIEDNYFVEKLLPSGVLRKLSEEELQYYREPFLTTESRKPLLQYTREIPLGSHEHTDASKLIKNYSDKLKKSPIPKLMLFAIPGFSTTIDSVQWAKANIANLETVDLGEAMHFCQESHPSRFANAIIRWLEEMK